MKESELTRLASTWTEAQWDDAEQVENVITNILGDKPSLSAAPFTALVVEERKRDPKTEILDVLDLVVLLGTEELLSARHNACVGMAKARRKPLKRGVRVIGVPGNRHGGAGVSIKEA